MSFLSDNYGIIAVCNGISVKNVFVDLIDEYENKISKYEMDYMGDDKIRRYDNDDDIYSKIDDIKYLFNSNTFWKTFRILYDSVKECGDDNFNLSIEDEDLCKICKQFYKKMFGLLNKYIVYPIKSKINTELDKNEFVNYCLSVNRISWIYLEGFYQNYFDDVLVLVNVKYR